MKNSKHVGMFTGALLLALAVSSCSLLDVVGRAAGTSFGALTGAIPPAYDGSANMFRLASPGGEVFSWSADFRGNPDFTVAFSAEPFLAAGLDPSKLPEAEYGYDAATGIITMPFDAGNDEFSYVGEKTAVKSFENIVKAYRQIVGYHEALDHYGISLGNGNMFEWAKDMGKNDKDVVFVLNPEPFIAAGADLSKVAGWAFAKVKMKDNAGKTVEKDKVLKPYDIR